MDQLSTDQLSTDQLSTNQLSTGRPLVNPSAKSKKKWMIAGAVVAVIVLLGLLGVIGYLVWRVVSDNDRYESRIASATSSTNDVNDTNTRINGTNDTSADVNMTNMASGSMTNTSEIVSTPVSPDIRCIPHIILVKISEYSAGEFSFYEEGTPTIQQLTSDKPKFIMVNSVVYSLKFKQGYDGRVIMSARNIVNYNEVTANDVYGGGASWQYKRLFLYPDKDIFSCADKIYTSKHTVKPIQNDKYFEISATDPEDNGFRAKFANYDVIYVKLANSFDGFTDTELMFRKYMDNGVTMSYEVYGLNDANPSPPSHMFVKNRYNMFYGETPVEIYVRPYPTLK